jgi:glycerol dehydrogenase-like iron-containing ADH family enzyme
LLSILTACFDWELAERAGRSEFPYQAADVAAARRILADVMERAAAIRACTDEGLQAIVDGYLRVNTICLPAGHYRVEEGSEHYLFYELEERLGRSFIHGWIVGLGVYVLSHLQLNRHAEAVDFMRRVGLRFQPADLQLRRQDLEASLLNLKNYVQRRADLWYTVIHEREIDPAWIEETLVGLEF